MRLSKYTGLVASLCAISVPLGLSALEGSSKKDVASLDEFALGNQDGNKISVTEWREKGQWHLKQTNCIVNEDAWSVGCGPTDKILPGAPIEPFLRFKVKDLVINGENQDIVELHFQGDQGTPFTGNEYYAVTMMDPDFLDDRKKDYNKFVEKRTKGAIKVIGDSKWWKINPLAVDCTWEKKCILDISELFYSGPGVLDFKKGTKELILLLDVYNKGTEIKANAKDTQIKVVRAPEDTVAFCKERINHNPQGLRFAYCWQQCVALKRNNCSTQKGDDLTKCMENMFEITGKQACFLGAGDKSEEDKSEEDKSDEDKSDEDKSDEDKPSESEEEPFVANCAEWNPCLKTAICGDKGGILTCTCPIGFEGDGFDFCISSEEKIPEEHEWCSKELNPCDVNATCTIDPKAQARCTCNTGYEGDGLKCTKPGACSLTSGDSCGSMGNCIFDMLDCGYDNNPCRESSKANRCWCWKGFGIHKYNICQASLQYTFGVNTTIKFDVPKVPKKFSIEIGKCLQLEVNAKTKTVKSTHGEHSQQATLSMSNGKSKIIILLHRDRSTISVVASVETDGETEQIHLTHPYKPCLFGNFRVHDITEGYDKSDIRAYVTENMIP